MGKIKLKTVTDTEQELMDAVKATKRVPAKKEAAPEAVVEAPVVVAEEVVAEKAPAKKSAPQAKKKVVGKNAKRVASMADRMVKMPLADAVELLKKMSYAKFDETVEVHVNIKEQGLKGDVVLPHGTGKEVRAVIVDDKILKEIGDGVFNFDILITTPANMSQLVPFARVLGPKGLMPNPKTGTVTDKPEEALKKFKGGTVNFKSEAKAPIIHQAVGKMSFPSEHLVANISAFLGAVSKKNIISVYIAGSMTPSVQIEF